MSTVDVNASRTEYGPPAAPVAAPSAVPASGREAPSPIAERRAPRAALEPMLVACVVAAALLLFRLPAELRVPGAFNDDGVYLVLGRALAEGEGYRNLHLVGAPPQVKFPPGMPVLLALLWGMLGSLERVVAAASILGAVAAGAAAGLAWWFGRSRLGAGRGSLALLCTGPMLLASAIDYWTLPIGESWFLLGWAAALLLLEPADGEAPGTARALGAGFAIAAAALFRTQAVTLLPAALLALALRRRWREAALVAVASLPPLAAWQLWAARAQAASGAIAAPDELGYRDWIPAGGPLEVMSALARAAMGNVGSYTVTMANHLGRPEWRGALLFATLVVLAVAGAALLRRTRPMLVLSVGLALLLLLLWPSPQDRLLFPVLPFVGLLAAAAVARLLPRASVEARLGALGAAVLVAGLVALRQSEIRATAQVGITGEGTPRFRTSSWFLPRNSRMIATAVRWARTEARPDDRVLTSLPSALWLYTGLPTMPGDPTESVVARTVWAVPGDYLRARIRDDGITALVIDTPRQRLAGDLRALWERCPSGFTNVAVGPWEGFPAVMRVNGGDACLRALLAEPRRA